MHEFWKSLRRITTVRKGWEEGGRVVNRKKKIHEIRFRRTEERHFQKKNMSFSINDKKSQ